MTLKEENPMLHPKRKTYFRVLLIVSTLLISACSNTPKTENNSNAQVLRVSYNKNETTADTNNVSSDDKNTYHQNDRWENFNRSTFRFNTGLDNILIKPAAKAYKYVMPELLDSGVSNFFSNLDDISNAINNLLQAKPRDAINDSARFLFNSSFGLGGFLDIASDMDLEKHDEDFGQTLAKWGVDSGPYLMLPALGPSTFRDAISSLSVDRAMNPVSYHDDAVAFTALQLLDRRSDILSGEESLKDLSDDTYSALRDIWLQRREYLIRDGVVDEKQQSDLIDQLESLDDE